MTLELNHISGDKKDEGRRKFSQAKSPFINTKMPIQSDTHYLKFQESELKESKKRKDLGNSVRPRMCPYCGEKECMILHQWVLRFLILGAEEIVNLLVPVYKCKECGRHIRVLPKECHVYHQYSSALILFVLRLYYRKGKYVRLRWIDPSLMRRWVKGFEENARSFKNLILKGIEKALEEIPRFSILFRSNVKIMGKNEDAGIYSKNQCPFTLGVCLNSL